ncbi:winged helix-turn-helix domain-containing protein [Klebsiella pneumoniae subsp. pneumoniae]|nr:winged helix-turn-helix domain-containing protein [Klebsiella pneumoniae subsp. pneumoniae]
MNRIASYPSPPARYSIFFLRHTGVVSRDEVLKKVWDDNGLTSSNSNLNQYLSMLRKTFRHYDIDNIIVTVSRGMLQLNQDLSIELARCRAGAYRGC